MATFAVQKATLAGAALTTRTASAGGDVLTPQGDSPIFLVIHNANAGASRTVTIDDPNTSTPEAASTFNPDVAITVTQSSAKVAVIRSPKRFINSSDGGIHLTYSSEADVTFEAYV